jgi:hypothetical protein
MLWPLSALFLVEPFGLLFFFLQNELTYSWCLMVDILVGFIFHCHLHTRFQLEGIPSYGNGRSSNFVFPCRNHIIVWLRSTPDWCSSFEGCSNSWKSLLPIARRIESTRQHALMEIICFNFPITLAGLLFRSINRQALLILSVGTSYHRLSRTAGKWFPTQIQHPGGESLYPQTHPTAGSWNTDW